MLVLKLVGMEVATVEQNASVEFKCQVAWGNENSKSNDLLFFGNRYPSHSIHKVS